MRRTDDRSAAAYSRIEASVGFVTGGNSPVYGSSVAATADVFGHPDSRRSAADLAGHLNPYLFTISYWGEEGNSRPIGRAAQRSVRFRASAGRKRPAAAESGGLHSGTGAARMLKWIGLALLVVIGLILFQQTVLRFVRRFWHFSSPPFFGPVLNSKLRLGLQRPDVVIGRSGIVKGMKVLDVGCGSGAYTTAAARTVGPGGRVYALDIQEAMLEQLDRKLAKPENADVDNVEIVHASAFEMPFEDNSFDAAFMVTAFHEIDDRKKAMLEVKRVLKPGGTLAVTQWLPYLDYPLRSTMVEQAERAGFELEASLGNFFHYTLRFKNNGVSH